MMYTYSTEPIVSMPLGVPAKRDNRPTHASSLRPEAGGLGRLGRETGPEATCVSNRDVVPVPAASS